MANVFHYKNENKEKYDGLIGKAKRVRNVGIGILVGMILLSFINPYSLMWWCSIFVGAVAIVFMDYKYCSLMAEADVLASGLNSFVMEKNQVRVKLMELCRVIKAYGVDLNMVIYDLFAFYKKNCPELLEGIGG